MSDQTALRVSDLNQNAPTPFELRPDSDHLKALAAELGLLGLKKLRFGGKISALGPRDWQLQAQLGATVVQSCVLTLDPVTTRLDTKVERRFLADMPEPELAEIEMESDDSIEKLGSWIDPAAIMAEALALALPLYPRSTDAALGEAVFTKPGQTPMRDEDARPFAGLAALRTTLDQPE
ncbi:MAG: YceD family protein [Sedimentitalea sp.]